MLSILAMTPSLWFGTGRLPNARLGLYLLHVLKPNKIRYAEKNEVDDERGLENQVNAQDINPALAGRLPRWRRDSLSPPVSAAVGAWPCRCAARIFGRIVQIETFCENYRQSQFLLPP
jgi:hypothetical protein